MCVIIEKPQGVAIPEKDLDRAWMMNHHGAGIIIPGQPPKAIKGLMKLSQLKETLEPLAENYVLIHLRMATHGAAIPANTHPFKCGDRRYLMHNGILSEYGRGGDKGRSDTAHFAEDISALPNKAIRRLLDTVYGKFIFVDRNSVSLHGEFHEHANCRWSNLYWLPMPKPIAKQLHGYQRVMSDFTKEAALSRYFKAESTTVATPSGIVLETEDRSCLLPNPDIDYDGALVYDDDTEELTEETKLVCSLNGIPTSNIFDTKK